MANTLVSSGGAAAALVFESTTFEVIIRDDQPWLKAVDLARALGYSRSDKITRLFERNSAEFTDSMTAVVETPTLGLPGNLVTQTRIFSLRGAHLLAMFARTAIAAMFRKWVLDILDAQTHQPALPQSITPAQAQHLRELVALVVESGKQGHGETWARLHRKLKVNSYLALHPDQFDAACKYLRTKMDDASIAAIALKHFPQIAQLSAPTQEPHPMPTKLSPAMLVSLINGGCLADTAVRDIAMAATNALYRNACMSPSGYGEEVSRKITHDLPLADLHAIVVRATMEMTLRVHGYDIDHKAAAQRVAA